MDNEKNNNASTDSDVMPSGGSTLGQAAKQGAKKTAQKGWKSFKEAVGRGIKALWQLLPMQVKIVVIVILFIFIILAALLMMGMIKESSSVVTSGVEDYISNANLDKDAKSLYEDKASLIKVKLKDINAMYDKFIDEDKGGAETQTLMKYSIGTNDVKYDKKDSRIVNIEDKLPLYKHILLTEKYNFNNVDWKKFSHNATAGEDIKDFKEDKERGLKYPDTTKNNAGDPKEVKLDKFIDLTLPYLQTWYIPLAMSNASVLNGTESDNNRAPAFSYNIIKEAYSNIVANWYELKKHTTVTRYYTYDEIKKHDMVTVEVIEREYENGAKNYSLRLGSSQTFEDSRTPKNTRTTSGIAGGTVDPMKEEAVSQKDEYTSHFYIKEADVFDAKIVNQFNYQVYSDADAAKRRNADSTNESIATYAKTMSTEDINKKGENAMYGLTVDSNGNISGANLDKASRFGNAIPQNDPTNTTKRTTAYSYNVTFKQYTDYENGLEHTVTRIWKDKLSQTDSETSDYTIDDLIMYNQSDKRKEKVDATALCGEDYSASSSSSSTSSGSTSSGSSSSSSSSNNSSSNSNRDGKGKVISTSNVNSTGYTGIYESRTTGRRFKEYKQNGNSYVFRYDISSVNCSWSSECGTVSTMIVGSGYSTKATFEDATKKLKSTGGGTQFTPWLSDYASDAKVKTINSPSQSQLKNLLKDGCVAVVHDPGYSANGHYMAILDISRDGTQIYVSNPDSYNAIQNGWNPISVFYSGGQYLTDCYFVSNKGNVTEYSGDSGDSSSTSDTTCTGTKSGKYYTSLKKTDGLNRIDFMNSNPDIFHRYIREGGEYYEYVGYSREKLKLSYWNLKDLFQKVYDKNDSLPWAYGKTLGFENIYSTSFSKYSGSSSSYKRGIFTWPVPEYVEAGKKLWDQIISTFGNRTHPITGQPGTMHNGIDIASSVNASAKIVAAADGKVVKASNTGDGYGNCVIIQHSGGYYTLYGHMSSLTVSVGDEVNKGQQIGIMGSTGNSTGNHLHFEIEKFDGDFSMSKYYSNTRLDPIDFFNEDCSPVGGGSGDLSEECIDFVWGWEGNDDYLESQGHLTSDHKYYIIYTDAAAGGNKAVGHGIDLNAGGYEAVLSKAGYSTNVGAKIPKEFVDNLSLENMSERKSEIEDKCSGLNLKDYQIDALICRSYQMGSTGWYYGDTWSYCPGETFVSAYKKWWDNGKSDRLYNNFMKYVTNGGEYGLIRRRESEWKLFKTGVYDWAH